MHTAKHAPSKGRYHGVKLTATQRVGFQNAAREGNARGFLIFLSEGGSPKELRALRFPKGMTLRQVLEENVHRGDLRKDREARRRPVTLAEIRRVFDKHGLTK